LLYPYPAHHPPDSFFRTLDSSVKKNSVFVKKLSGLTEQNRDKLVADLNSLNLTKYIEEVVNAICSAKL
jgi:regulator of nonsense transcripts 2